MRLSHATGIRSDSSTLSVWIQRFIPRLPHSVWKEDVDTDIEAFLTSCQRNMFSGATYLQLAPVLGFNVPELVNIS
jgi:hypothetical protein